MGSPRRDYEATVINNLYKAHSGCYFKSKEIIAMWSEKYSNPKLDQECYLARCLFKNNSTILTLASFSSKEEADAFLEETNRTC